MTSHPRSDMIAKARASIDAASKVLAKAALLDPRMSVDEGTIAAWAELLAPANLDEADLVAAVMAHYATSSERIMPAELLRLARARRNDRINRTTGNDTAPAVPQLPPATVEARREAIAAAVAKIGDEHHPDTRRNFETAPTPAFKPSQATIAAKVAKARAGWTPPVHCSHHADAQRVCLLAEGHLGPHHYGTAIDAQRAARRREAGA